MKTKDYEKMKKKETPKRIIQRFMNNEFYLTDKQLNEVITLKGPIGVGVNCKKG